MPVIECITLPLIQPATVPGQPPALFGTQQQWMSTHGPGTLVEVGFDPAMFGAALGVVPVTNASAQEGVAAIVPATPEQTIIQPRQVLGLIDTGASASCIDESLAQELNLPLVNIVPVGGAGGSHMLNVYMCRLMIPPLNFSRVGVFVGAKLKDGNQIHQALIGRDFLSQMVFIYDGLKGRATLAV